MLAPQADIQGLPNLAPASHHPLSLANLYSLFFTYFFFLSTSVIFVNPSWYLQIEKFKVHFWPLPRLEVREVISCSLVFRGVNHWINYVKTIFFLLSFRKQGQLFSCSPQQIAHKRAEEEKSSDCTVSSIRGKSSELKRQNNSQA